jgi:hypothetical protein
MHKILQSNLGIYSFESETLALGAINCVAARPLSDSNACGR